jgi:predicted dehydrogenase
MGIDAESIGFRVRKLARYTRLYGPRLALTKVMARVMRNRTPARPLDVEPRPGQTVGIIGCGVHAFSIIAYYLYRDFGPVIAACMDRHLERAAALAQYYHAPIASDNAETVIDHPAVRMVYIASNHASHAQYAIAALEAGKSVFIEKPHAVNEDQLFRLREAMHRTVGRVFLGFNRPLSRFGRIIAERLAAESGPGMYSWFIVGHELGPDHWYLNPQEGGRVLGNICHWTDFILRIVPRNPFPIRINPTCSSQDDPAIAFTFPDGTIAVICFSSKSYTFEGIRERFSAQKGNCLIFLDDFQRLTVEVIERKWRYRSLRRNQGHRAGICEAFLNVRDKLDYDRAAETEYIWNTGWLFLKTKEAVDSGREMIIGQGLDGQARLGALCGDRGDLGARPLVSEPSKQSAKVFCPT